MHFKSQMLFYSYKRMFKFVHLDNNLKKIAVIFYMGLHLGQKECNMKWVITEGMQACLN